MTWRRLLVLVLHLPADSALVRAQLGEAAQWTIGEHLLANVVDALQVANWQRQAKKGSKPPKPLPRPGVSASTTKVKPTRSYTPDEMVALRAGMRREEVT